MNLKFWFKQLHKCGIIVNDYSGWDFRMWLLAVLTGFSYKEPYGQFVGTKNHGHNNKVTDCINKTTVLRR